ncbi:hypothetical protein KFZ76_15960 [Methylovulum psychrotolerans]|uniref:hypothetical protein n=1 Tax=Methylovulum psychrotolerans TaxID=1704499 RepID=UPI001BFF5673|nr:hypothetical protein [Methylovulum psychrotolerans]MBT9099189.1 hypothetical protein [Methylovulum psychrotolerans]
MLIEGVKLEIDKKNTNRTLIKNQVSNLLTGKKIIKNGDQYSISNEESLRIESILERVNYQERLIFSEFENILDKYNCKHLVNDIFILIRGVFQVNFGSELNELNHKLSNYESDIKGKFHELERYLQGKSIDKESQLAIIRQLIEASGKNEYFSKVSVTSLYVGLFNNNKLNKYILNKELFVCIDTQVLLRFICVKHERVDAYSDKSYLATKNLIDCISNSKNKIHLFTTVDYVNECVSHLWNAVKLDRFSRLDYIKELGPSENVFYNFHIFLSEKSRNINSSIIEFIEDLIGKNISGLNHNHFEHLVNSKLISMLDMVGLEVKSHSEYKEFSAVKREYEISLAKLSFKRSNHAITNDVRTAVFLGQEDRFIDSNRVYSEPFLITWDSSFQYLRDVIYRIPDFASWHLYTPLKFIDRVCVMNFRVSPENISMNIASLIEEDFTTSSKFVSFFDVMSSYFETQNVSELKIARRLVELKERTFNVDVIDDFSKDREKYSSLTDLLIEIRAYYHKNNSMHSFDDVISVFEDNNYEERIIDILKTALSREQTTEKFAKALDLIIQDKKSAA